MTTDTFVRAELQPDSRRLSGDEHVAMLRLALARIEKDPRMTTTAALGQHLQFDEICQVPHGVDAARWLRARVLPRAVAAQEAANA